MFMRGNTTCALAEPCFRGFLSLYGVRKEFNEYGMRLKRMFAYICVCLE
jgi:hypothetical protein